ncbi:MAG: hypothetical protein QXT19_02815 [Candidatus Woesearchaeota archaeon]
MNTHKTFGIFGIVLLCALALVGAAAAIPVNITRVEIDDQKILPDQSNRLDVLRDNKVEFEVLLEASEDVDDVEVTVFVSGFEHNKELRLSDSVGPFDMDANITYRKTLHITFPDLVEEDNYKVRVVVTDRDGDELIQNYNIKIDVPRHDLQVVDAIFTPSRRVQAGQALLTVVRVENFGEKDEEDVKVTVAVPALGISASDYIDEIENDEAKETEELYLRIPKCTKPGVYEMTIDVKYNDGFSKTGVKGEIEVLEDPACKEPETAVVQLPPPQANNTVEAVPRTSGIRKALEIILLCLVALLVIIGLIIGFTKMGASEEPQ